MDKENKSLTAKFDFYSDDKLIEILTFNRSAYTTEAFLSAEKVLNTRGITLEELNEAQRASQESLLNQEYLKEKAKQESLLEQANFLNQENSSNQEELENSEFDPIKLKLPDGSVIFSKDNVEEESFNPLTRINSIVDGVEKNEKEISKILYIRYTNLSDEELLSLYGRIVNKINENGVFGLSTDEDSIENYGILLKVFEKRALKNSNENQKNHVKVARLLYRTLSKKNRRNGFLNIFIGILLLLIFLVFIAAKSIRPILILLIILGVQRIIAGVNQIKLGNEFNQKMYKVKTR